MLNFGDLCVITSRRLMYEHRYREYPTDHKLLKTLLKDLLATNGHNSLKEIESNVQSEELYITPGGFNIKGEVILTAVRVAKSDMTLSPLPMKNKEENVG